MTSKLEGLVWWGPRISGILVAAFLAVFALDAFDRRSVLEALPAFAIHLIPAFLVLGVVAIAWRFEWIGAAGFIALAAIYGVMVHWRGDWVAAISAPLFVVGVLFLVSWWHRASAGVEQR